MRFLERGTSIEGAAPRATPGIRLAAASRAVALPASLQVAEKQVILDGKPLTAGGHVGLCVQAALGAVPTPGLSSFSSFINSG